MSDAPLQTSGNPSPKAVIWLRRDSLRELAELMESYAVSLREAAWRGSDANVGATLQQLRLVLLEAIRVYRTFAPSQDDGGVAQ
jgi:hypothetical protein